MVKNFSPNEVDETVTGFDTFSQYKDALKRNKSEKFTPKGDINKDLRVTYVYHGANDDKGSLESMENTGGSGFKEFYGRNIGQYHGRGIYTMIRYEDVCVGNGAVVRYAVKPGAFDNFVIWEPYIRDILYKRGALTRRYESVGDTLRRLLDDKSIEYLKQKGVNLDRVDEDYFFRTITSDEPRSKYGHFGEETRLDMTNIDGFCFTYGNGPCAMFRTADILIPNKVISPRHGDRYSIKDDEQFDRLNTYTDVYRRIRHRYPGTAFHEKTSAGFTLIGNKDKGNWVNGRTGKLFSPIPLKNCTPFSQIDKTASFTMGNFEFKVISINNAEDATIFYKPIGATDNKYKELPGGYKGFINMIMTKLKAQPQKMNESFTTGDYDSLGREMDNTITLGSTRSGDEFKRFSEGVKSGKNVYFYTCSWIDRKKSILTNGMSYEFNGSSSDSSMIHGISAYGTFTLHGALRNMSLGYGDTIYRFILKDDISKYLIADPPVRRAFGLRGTLIDQIKEMCEGKTYKGQPMIDMVKHKLGTIENLVRSDAQGGALAAFFDCFKGNYVGPLNNGKQFEETALNVLGVHGYIYNGGKHHDTIVVRNFNALMPVGYAYARNGDPSQLHKDSNGNIIWSKNEYLTKDLFDRLNNNVSARYQYGAEYPDTPLLTKQTCGLSLVKGKQGYNYMDTKTHRHLLPVDVPSATAFSVVDKSATFDYLGGKWTIVRNGDNDFLMYINGKQVQPSQFAKVLDIARSKGMKIPEAHPDALFAERNVEQLNEGKNVTTNKGIIGGLGNLLNKNTQLKGLGESLFNNENQVYNTINTLIAIYNKGIFFQNNARIDGPKKAKQAINDLLTNDKYLPLFKDEEARTFAFYCVYGREKLPFGTNIDDNKYYKLVTNDIVTNALEKAETNPIKLKQLAKHGLEKDYVSNLSIMPEEGMEKAEEIVSHYDNIYFRGNTVYAFILTPTRRYVEGGSDIIRRLRISLEQEGYTLTKPMGREVEYKGDILRYVYFNVNTKEDEYDLDSLNEQIINLF